MFKQKDRHHFRRDVEQSLLAGRQKSLGGTPNYIRLKKALHCVNSTLTETRDKMFTNITEVINLRHLGRDLQIIQDQSLATENSGLDASSRYPLLGNRVPTFSEIFSVHLVSKSDIKRLAYVFSS